MIIRMNIDEVQKAITEYLMTRHKDWAPEEELTVSSVVTGTGDAYAVEVEVYFIPKEKDNE